MSALSGIRWLSTTSTPTRQPSSCFSMETMLSGVRPVRAAISRAAIFAAAAAERIRPSSAAIAPPPMQQAGEQVLLHRRALLLGQLPAPARLVDPLQLAADLTGVVV